MSLRAWLFKSWFRRLLRDEWEVTKWYLLGPLVGFIMQVRRSNQDVDRMYEIVAKRRPRPGMKWDNTEPAPGAGNHMHKDK